MNKIYFYLIVLFFLKTINSFAFEGECLFEEVYKNGEIQNGLLLISDQEIRYEYFNNNFFTIIYSEGNFYLISNNDRENFEKINDQRLNVFQNLVNIVQSYPNINKHMTVDGLDLLIEDSQDKVIPKRIVVKSSKVNLSIYLNQCKEKPISKLFFKFNPIFEYPLK